MSIPPDLEGALQRYVEHGIPTGHFLQAVLSNDLKEAVARADDRNIRILPEIVCYCYNHLPYLCWGSAERVNEWLRLVAQRPTNPGAAGAEPLAGGSPDE